MQVESSITLGYDVDEWRSFDVCLPTTALDNDLGWLDHCKHARAADLLRFAGVGDVRSLQLGAEGRPVA